MPATQMIPGVFAYSYNGQATGRVSGLLAVPNRYGLYKSPASFT